MTRLILSVLAATALSCPVVSRAGVFEGRQPDTTRVNSHLGAGVVGFYPMYFERPYLGWQAYWSLRPSAARYFYEGFEKLQVGFEVNAAFLDLTDGRGWIDASVVFHKYLTADTGPVAKDAAFVGAGIGIVGVKWDSENVRYRDVSYTVEMGYEYRSLRRVVVTFKAQARYLEAGPINFNGGGFVITAGWQYD